MLNHLLTIFVVASLVVIIVILTEFSAPRHHRWVWFERCCAVVMITSTLILGVVVW